MHALAAERGVAPDRILADAVGAWIEAGMPKVDIPRNVVPIYEGKREELAYYLALRWWLRQKRGAY
jgi:hypothetical protein